MRTALSIAAVATTLAWAPGALAQDPTPGGTASGSASVDTSGSAGATVTPPHVSAPHPEVAGAEDTTPDHDKFVGRFAVTYLGITQLPIAGGVAPGLNPETLSAPNIGVRYWMTRLIGLDVGVGFALRSASSETSAAGTRDDPGAFGMNVHGGVPLALAAGRHYTFEVIPELNLGFATRTVKPVGPGVDETQTGSLLSLGGRVGAEVHFGFIGVPELALQATVGVYVSRLARKTSRDAFNNNPAAFASSSTLDFGTSVQSDPWALFANNIAALYYF